MVWTLESIPDVTQLLGSKNLQNTRNKNLNYILNKKNMTVF